MATLRNKRKLSTVRRETTEEHPRSGQSRNTSVTRNTDEYITQVSEDIEDRVINKLSQEFSRTESRLLGALSKLDEFFLHPRIRTHSAAVPETFRNTDMESWEPTEHRSQNDLHPEAGPSVCQSRHSTDPDTDEAPRNIHYSKASLKIAFFRKSTNYLCQNVFETSKFVQSCNFNFISYCFEKKTDENQNHFNLCEFFRNFCLDDFDLSLRSLLCEN